MSEYIPSPTDFVAAQVELYEGSGGTDGLNNQMGMPVVIVTNTGWKTGAIRKTPVMRVVDGKNYILVASKGGAPTKSQLVSQSKSGTQRPNSGQDRSLFDAGSRSVRFSREKTGMGHCG